MSFAAAVSTRNDLEEALAEVLAAAPGPSDLALLFFSPQHSDALARQAGRLRETLGVKMLAGCPGETIVAGDQEIEQPPALALWRATWPAGVTMTPFHLSAERTSEGLSVLGWPDELPEKGMLLTLGDPYSFPTDPFLDAVNAEHPGLTVVGGMASGVQEPATLLLGSEAHTGGAACILLPGPLPYRTVVSQGCRPIGVPMVITKADDHLILERGGKSPLARLQELWPDLSQRDQDLVRHGLHVGRVTSEYRDSFGRGDFLVRNVIGLDRNTGALAITDHVRPGQTVQFHVRDAASADEDLRVLLEGVPRGSSSGALLFSCNGRGSRLFDTPHHDAGLVHKQLGAIPLAGFFAQGELGPIAGQNFIHGFTASLVLFE